MEWTITFEDGHQETRSGSSTSVTAGSRAGSIKVEARSNGCVRHLTFQVVEPEEVRLHHRTNLDRHVQGLPSAFEGFCVEILPNDVSFEGVTVGEQSLDGFDQVTGFFLPVAGEQHPEWTHVVMPNNYLPGEVDWSGFMIPAQGYMDYLSDPDRIDESVAEWAIPWFFVDTDPQDPQQDPQVVFDTLVAKKTLLLDGTAKVEKDGIEVSFGLHDPDTNLDLPVGWQDGCDPGPIVQEEGCNDE